MEITLRNYRAFADTEPARWTLDGPFTALVGVNNAGKSSLLRFFHEARPSLHLAAEPQSGSSQQALRASINVSFQSVADLAEVFCNRNDRDMTARFVLPPPEDPRA